MRPHLIDEVAVIATAKTLHSTTSAAPLFAIWGSGSFIGGLLVSCLGGGARTATGLTLWLGALTAGHLALMPADRSVGALGAVLLVAGAAIARPRQPCIRSSATPPLRAR